MSLDPYPPMPEGLVRRDVRVEPRSAIIRAREAVIADEAFPRLPRIVSTSAGPIRSMLLWYPAHSPDTWSYRPVYEALLGSLPTETELTIVVHPAVRDEL